MDRWVEPTRRFQEYDLTFLVPQDTDQVILNGILEAHGLPQEVFQFTREESPLAELFADGLLKIVYSNQTQGVLWHDRGNKSPETWETFSRRLEETLMQAGLKEVP